MVACIVLFGGRGSRFKHSEPKQYFEISGKSLLVHCLESLKVIKQLSQLVIVCEQTERERISKMLNKMTPFDRQVEINFCNSGHQRYDSVLNGLKTCRSNTKHVLIHDGARAFCPPTLLNNLCENLLEHGGGVVPALPLVDTIVKVTDDHQTKIQLTLDRDRLRRVQTPQAFEYCLILKAYLLGKKNNFKGTDCSSYFLQLGHEVKVIEGSEENIKVTTPIDVEIVKHIMKTRDVL